MGRRYQLGRAIPSTLNDNLLVTEEIVFFGLLPVAYVRRHRVLVKVCLIKMIDLWNSLYCLEIHLVDGVLLGDRDHSGWVARYVPHANIAST